MIRTPTVVKALISLISLSVCGLAWADGGEPDNASEVPVYSQAMAQVADSEPDGLVGLQVQTHWPKDWQSLRDELEQRTQRLGVGYAELVIFDGDGVRERARFGQDDVTTAPPVLAGQFSEVFTALAVMQLVESGQWSLFDRVSQRLPDLPIENAFADTQPLLLIHLLEHASGFDQRRFKSHYLTSDQQGINIQQRLQNEAAGLRVRWPPGAASRHSALNYGVLAAMLEAHYRQPWAEVIETQIIHPLSLQSTHLAGIRAENVIVSGYSGLPASSHPFRGRVFAEAEGSWMSIDDMVVVGRHLLTRGASSAPALLRADTIALMEIPRSTLAADAGLSYGMGIGIDNRARFGLWHGRQSSLDGYSVSLRYDSEQGVGYALVVNHESILPALDEPVWQYLVAQQPAVNIRAGGVNLEQRWQGWYRLQNPQHALLAPLQNVFDLAYIRRDGALLTLDPLIGVQVPLRSVDGSRLAHRDDGTIVGVLFSDEAGNQRVQVHNDVRQKVSATAALAPISLFALGLIILLSHPFGRSDSLRQPWMRRLTTLAVLCFILAIFVAGSLTLEQATSDNWRSILLFVFTALGPLLAFAALILTISGWRGETMQVARWRSLLGAVAASAFALWMIQSGWFALRLWVW